MKGAKLRAEPKTIGIADLKHILYTRGSQTFGVMEPMKRLTIIYGAHNKFLKIKTKKTRCYLPIDIPE